MSFELSSSTGHFNVTNRQWEWLIRLAKSYGWKPMGVKVLSWETGGYEGRRSQAHYTLNDPSIIEAKDAANLAAALRKHKPPQDFFVGVLAVLDGGDVQLG